MIPAMRSDAFIRSSAVNFTVTCHVEVITDVVKSTVSDVIPPAVVKAQAHALRRGRAVNDNECDSSHQCMQEVTPNTPAKAVTTVTITLRTTPHTDLDFFSINLLNLEDKN